LLHINQKTFIMAVTAVKIKERLKIKYPKANLSTKRLDAIADKLATKPADDADDAAIDLVLEDFNGIMSFEDIAKEDDRVRTLEANQKKPTDPPTPPNPPADPPAPPKPADDPNQKLLDAIGKLTGEVEALKSGKVVETKSISAKAAFENSEVLKGLTPEVKENWLKRLVVTPETTEDEIAAQVTNLETEYSGLTQNIANNLGYSGPPPAGDTVKGSEQKVIDNVVDQFNI